MRNQNGRTEDEIADRADARDAEEKRLRGDVRLLLVDGQVRVKAVYGDD